jgi:hypothetical protein
MPEPEYVGLLRRKLRLTLDQNRQLQRQFFVTRQELSQAHIRLGARRKPA